MISEKRKKKLLIVLDWIPPQNWQFEEILSRYFSADMLYSQTPKGYDNIVEKITGLWKSYFLTSLRAATRASQYDVIYSWHAVIGMLTSFWLRFFFINEPKLVTGQMIIPERVSLFNRFFRIPFTKCTVKRIETVIVHSKIEAYQLKSCYPYTNFVFVPLGIEQNIRETGDDNYIFSGGRSNRDYKTLFKAVEELDYPTKIVAQKFNISGLDVPENVNVYFNVFGDFFDELLARAAVVVIPLDRPDESSGQLVLLQAMSYGKPIIVTENRGLLDYIEPGKNAFTVPPHDYHSLRTELKNLFENPLLKKMLGNNARDASAQFTQDKQAQRIAELLTDA